MAQKWIRMYDGLRNIEKEQVEIQKNIYDHDGFVYHQIGYTEHTFPLSLNTPVRHGREMAIGGCVQIVNLPTMLYGR